MSLLPEIERELLRVARRPLPHGTGVGGAAARRRGKGFNRRSLSTAALIASALLAIAVAAVFVSALHTPRHGPAGGRTSSGRSGAFQGAPHSQPNGLGVATGVCPLAAPSRYLPPRSGCITVRRADVTGGSRPDLILLFSTLSRERATGFQGGLSQDYPATAAVLRVVRAGG